MGLKYTIQTICEIIVIGFIILGFFNEDRIVAFENRLFANIRRKKLKLFNATQSNNK